MNKPVCILEFPTNLGLKRMHNDREPGVRHLPDFFKLHNFHTLINPETTVRLDAPEYEGRLDPESGVLNADLIIQYAKQQANLLSDKLTDNYFPIVLGGDCSILIGNSIALKEFGPIGLFFLDGHTDFMQPRLSQTGGAAGMDLSIVTGHGHEKLTNIDNLGPYVEEQNVFCVGNREYDPEYVQQIIDSDIEYVSLDRLRTEGIEATVTKFLHRIRKNELDGFWIHIDVDVLHDDIMPAVDSRQEDGLTYPEFSLILGLLLKSEKALGLDITILDPTLDPKAVFASAFIQNFCTTFRSVFP